MVGSIDPRCETLRGTHWPKPGRVVDWNSRRGNHLGQRSPTASTGRTYGCKRSDHTSKNSCGTGAVHIWVPASAGTTDGASPHHQCYAADRLAIDQQPHRLRIVL